MVSKIEFYFHSLSNQTESDLANLPTELVLSIYQKIPFLDQVRLSQTCHQFRIISESNLLGICSQKFMRCFKEIMKRPKLLIKIIQL